MAEVTGFTADRMRIIENETVVDGEVQGDNLILVTREGVPIDAGNVRGPQGTPGLTGPPGPVNAINDQVGAAYAPRIFATRAEIDTLWPTAPNGAMAITTDLGLLWRKFIGLWSPVDAGFAGSSFGLGGFPAGAYNWPASLANIQGYGISNSLLYADGRTQFAGLYTITLTFEISTSDGGDISMDLWMNGYIYAATGKAVYGCTSMSVTRVMPANAEIKWSMYKHANTGVWTGSWVRIDMAYHIGSY